jgi:hypothetical protein
VEEKGDIEIPEIEIEIKIKIRIENLFHQDLLKILVCLQKGVTHLQDVRPNNS